MYTINQSILIISLKQQHKCEAFFNAIAPNEKFKKIPTLKSKLIMTFSSKYVNVQFIHIHTCSRMVSLQPIKTSFFFVALEFKRGVFCDICKKPGIIFWTFFWLIGSWNGKASEPIWFSCPFILRNQNNSYKVMNIHGSVESLDMNTTRKSKSYGARKMTKTMQIQMKTCLFLILWWV